MAVMDAAQLRVLIGADISQMQRGMAQAGQQVQSFGGRAAKILTGTVGIAVAAAAVKAAKDSVEIAGQFEAQTNILGMAARNSGTAIEDLSAAALAVGADTELVGVDALQAAEALTNFYKAGLSTEDVFVDLNGYLNENASLSGAMRAAADLAAASELNLAEASDAVVIAMSTFGIEADEATGIADTFVAAADASVTSVPELTEALTNAGPTLASFGWSLEDANTALALLSSRGIRGAEAGTALKSMLTNMMRPTKEVAETWEALGVSLYDSDGAMRPMVDVIGELSAALELGSTRTTVYKQISEEQEGQLAELTATYDELAAELDAYQSGMEGTGLTEAERADRMAEISDAMRGVSDEMAPLIEASGKYAEITETMTEKQRNQYIQALAGTYGMKAMNTLLAEGDEGWREMGAAMDGAATAQETATARTAGLQGAQERLGGAIQTFMIQVGTPLIEKFLTPAVDGLTNFVGKISEFITKGPDFQGILEGLPEPLQTLAEKIGGISWEGISADLAQLLPVRDADIANLAANLRAGVASAWATVSGELGKIIGLQEETLASIGTTIKAGLLSVFQTIRAKGPLDSTLGESLGTIIGNAMGNITADIGEYATGLWNIIMSWLTAAFGKFQENASQYGSNLGEILGTLLRNAITFLVTEVPKLATSLFETIKKFVTEAHTPGNVEGLGTSILDFFSAALDSFITALLDDPQWKEKLTAWADTNISQPVKDFVAAINFIPEAKQAFQTLIDGINEKIADIKQTISDVVYEITHPFGEINLRQAGADAIEGLKAGAEAKVNGVGDWFSRAGDNIVNTVTGVFDAHSPSRVFMGIGEDMMEGWLLGMQRGMPLVGEALGSLSGAPAGGGVHNWSIVINAGAGANATDIGRQAEIGVLRAARAAGVM